MSLANTSADSGSVAGLGIAADFRANAVVALTIHNNTIQHTDVGGISIE
jgi:hypothetical protein